MPRRVISGTFARVRNHFFGSMYPELVVSGLAAHFLSWRLHGTTVLFAFLRPNFCLPLCTYSDCPLSKILDNLADFVIIFVTSSRGNENGFLLYKTYSASKLTSTIAVILGYKFIKECCVSSIILLYTVGSLVCYIVITVV